MIKKKINKAFIIYIGIAIATVVLNVIAWNSRAFCDAYIACVESDHIIFQYSGYLSVLNYLDNDFYRAIGKHRDKYYEQEVIKEQVHIDNVFVKDEEWERSNAEAVLDTELVDEVSDAFIDTTLKVNGVSEGAVSYSRVVNRLL